MKLHAKDLLKFLAEGKYQLFVVLVDRNKAASLIWDEKAVIKRTANAIVENFVLALLARNIKGRLVAESATSQKDFAYYKEANYYLSNGMSSVGASFSDVQSALTEISFVTKKNHDVEEQVADLMSYGAKLKFLGKTKAGYETTLLKIFERKLFRMQPNTGAKKRKYYSKIDSFKTL